MEQNELKDLILTSFNHSNIDPKKEKINDLITYINMLKEWNKKFNLTAITDFNEIVIKHFEDSLTVLKYININKDSKIIDIGTGAGFPGVPLKIMRPDINITLLDSLNKRLIFLTELTNKLHIPAKIIHARAENISHEPEYREVYDFAVSRAVAQLNTLLELSLPFVILNGYFLAMKGKDSANEIKSAETALNALGGKIEDVINFNLSDDSPRSIIVIKKISQTPLIYPRTSAKILKSPL